MKIYQLELSGFNPINDRQYDRYINISENLAKTLKYGLTGLIRYAYENKLINKAAGEHITAIIMPNDERVTQF